MCSKYPKFSKLNIFSWTKCSAFRSFFSFVVPWSFSLFFFSSQRMILFCFYCKSFTTAFNYYGFDHLSLSLSLSLSLNIYLFLSLYYLYFLFSWLLSIFYVVNSYSTVLHLLLKIIRFFSLGYLCVTLHFTSCTIYLDHLWKLFFSSFYFLGFIIPVLLFILVLCVYFCLVLCIRKVPELQHSSPTWYVLTQKKLCI